MTDTQNNSSPKTVTHPWHYSLKNLIKNILIIIIKISFLNIIINHIFFTDTETITNGPDRSHGWA